MNLFDVLYKDTFEASDALAIFLEKEQKIYRRCDYLSSSSSCTVTVDDRLKIVDWMFSVIDSCQYKRDTVSIAVELLDRFLSKDTPLVRLILAERTQFQLLSMATLYIAIKTNEQVVFGSDFFAVMSRGDYTKQDIETMELAVLETLDWRISAPTAIQIAHHVLSPIVSQVSLSASTWAFVLDEVCFQSENALRDYTLAIQRSSTVAIAAIFNTLDQLDSTDRQSVLVALISILTESFVHPRELKAAKIRLLSVIKGELIVEDSLIASDDCESVTSTESLRTSQSPIAIDDCESVASTESLRTSQLPAQECRRDNCPITLFVCSCRRESILCQKCISSSVVFPNSDDSVRGSITGVKDFDAALLSSL